MKKSGPSSVPLFLALYFFLNEMQISVYGLSVVVAEPFPSPLYTGVKPGWRGGGGEASRITGMRTRVHFP